MQTNRIMVFYDGAFFRQGEIFFRYKMKRGWFSLPELHATIEKYVAQKSKTPVDITKVVGAHFYEGRLSTKVADQEQLVKERNFEMALIAAGIVPHYLAMSEVPKSKGVDEDVEYTVKQKGIDVHLALDVLDFGHQNRFDVAALVTGDGDFVPLVRKLTSLGREVLICHFEFETWTDTRNKAHRPCRCAKALIDAATCSLNFNTFVKDPDWKTEVKALFFMPRQKAEELV